jgi:hypothetical protein
LPLPALLVSVTLPPLQNVDGPEAEMAGVAATAFTCTSTGADSAEQPPAPVTTTE